MPGSKPFHVTAQREPHLKRSREEGAPEKRRVVGPSRCGRPRASWPPDSRAHTEAPPVFALEVDGVEPRISLRLRHRRGLDKIHGPLSSGTGVRAMLTVPRPKNQRFLLPSSGRCGSVGFGGKVSRIRRSCCRWELCKKPPWSALRWQKHQRCKASPPAIALRRRGDLGVGVIVLLRPKTRVLNTTIVLRSPPK